MHFRRPFSRVLGQSIDFWSVPHFLFGVLIAMIVQVFSFPAVPLFMVMLSIAILWEIVEMRLKIRESLINVFSDRNVRDVWIHYRWIADLYLRSSGTAHSGNPKMKGTNIRR
jgi:hypothetical protein